MTENKRSVEEIMAQAERNAEAKAEQAEETPVEVSEIPETPVRKMNVEYVTKILEQAVDGGSPGVLLIPTYSEKELELFASEIGKYIDAQQPDRIKAVNAGEEGYVVTQAGEDEPSVILTEAEQRLLMHLAMDSRIIDNAVTDKVLGDETLLTNLPKFKNGGIGIANVSVDKASGAVNKVRARLNMGVERDGPLWASGFRIRLSSPSAISSLNLETNLSYRGITDAADSYGFSLSSFNIAQDEMLIDFILDHVEYSTSGTTDKEQLLELIQLTDLKTMTLKMASTMFPGGYQIVRTIYEGEGKDLTTKEVTSTINLNRMLVVKSKYFSELHHENVYKLSGTISREEIETHQSSIRPEVDRRVPIGNGLYARLAVPSLATYLRIGNDWKARMDATVRKLLGSNDSPEVRAQYLQRATNIVRVMYMAHWVEAIEEQDDDGVFSVFEGLERMKVVNGTDGQIAKRNKIDSDIAMILSDLSVIDKRCDEFMEAIHDFVAEMTLTFCIVPRDSRAGKPKDEIDTVIVVDPAELFFTLLRHKTLLAGG